MRQLLGSQGEARIALLNDPTSLAPETLIVFELRSSLVTFAEAVRVIDGFELIAEEDGEVSDDDGAPIPGHFYAVFTNEEALHELLSLWQRWSNGEKLQGALKAWEKVFACLSDLRRWGPKDRVSKVHADVIKRVVEDLEPGQTIHLDFELIYRRGAAADLARERVLAQLGAAGARVVTTARYDGFAFDAILIEVTAEAALAVADRLQESVAGISDAYRIRPQSIGYGLAGEDRDNAPARADNAPEGNPIAAVFDGVPIANHPYLAGRIALDDPDDLTSRSVGSRAHGTAMASLVIYGDLNKDGDTVRRGIYLRPFLADTDNFPGFDNERTLPDRILVDDLVRATRRIKVGDEGGAAQAPEVVVINLSFGIPDLIFDETMSPLARCLDWLAWEYGVLFVVSAGNAVDPLKVQAYGDENALIAASVADRTERFLEALRDVRNVQKVLSPAEAMNALTVGALHDDEIKAAHTIGRSYDPLPEGVLPSIQSRIGLGYGRSAKPDVVAPGGRLRVLLHPTESPLAAKRDGRASRFGGLRVAGGMNGQQAQLTWSGATSAAAAVTTHALHKVHDALEDGYGEAFLNLPDAHRALLLKALLVHRTRRPVAELQLIEKVFGQGQQRHHSVQKAEIARLFGFGSLDEDASTFCAFNRATAWATGEVRADRGLSFSLPLPIGLNGQAVTKAITATVCWFSPILPGRQGYRAVRLVVDEGDVGFSEAIHSLGTKVSSNQLDSNGTRRGTVFHRRWDGQKAANFHVGSTLEVKVSRMPDVAADAPELVPFALAISIETDANIPIYEQVLQGIDVALRPRVAQPVIV
ncbi:S8 family serine peptidase [Bradyrhizobium yuanmingense]|uniref:S8 family serine peptidase n=1 Tax=Bradyrhizobium yuanmingense TaxID=108015 RepID=UPI003518FE95